MFALFHPISRFHAQSFYLSKKTSSSLSAPEMLGLKVMTDDISSKSPALYKWLPILETQTVLLMVSYIGNTVGFVNGFLYWKHRRFC